MRTTPPPRVDVADVFPQLAGLARCTVRLHPRCGPEPDARESKLGGRFLWPSDEPWPVCQAPEYRLEGPTTPRRAHVYVPVLQLRQDDVPELPFPDGADLFQLLWCPNDHPPAYGPICRTFWRRQVSIAEPLRSAPPPGDAEPDFVPRSCRLHPERVVEYPNVADLPDNLARAVFDWQGTDAGPLYEWELSVADGTKVGGYVRWVQDPEIPPCACGRPMTHLLTVASVEFDSGSWRRWCPVEDAHVCWSAPLAERLAAQAASGIMLGDMGSLYVFACAACPDRPIAWVMQCS